MIGATLPPIMKEKGQTVLTLSFRQANFCYLVTQARPWVKVMERSSSTFSQTCNLVARKLMSRKTCLFQNMHNVPTNIFALYK